MSEENKAVAPSSKQTNSLLNAVRWLVLGFFLSLTMNFALTLAVGVLSVILGPIVRLFFLDTSYFSKIVAGSAFGAIFFINLVVFVYLIIKRRFMGVGMLAGIPVFLFGFAAFWVVGFIAMGLALVLGFWTIALTATFPAVFLALIPVFILIFLVFWYAVVLILSHLTLWAWSILSLFDWIPTLKKCAGIREIQTVQ